MHIYSQFLRAVPDAKGNRNWWQEAETCRQAVLHSPSCHPGQGTWGHTKGNTTRSKWLYFWRSKVALHLKPACAYATISIKFYLAMYQIGTLLKQPTLSRQVRDHPPCLQWQVVLCARWACGSWTLALQEGVLSIMGQVFSHGHRLHFPP